MILKTIQELRNELKNKQSIGFVPTMGYLHEGHLSLIERAKENNETVVVSIFVNPTQFAPGEDYESYPRNIDRDNELAVSAGADIIFYPDVNEIYDDNASTFVSVEGEITRKLCGKSRPTHFRGVTSVVNILFNIVKPNRAYFGQKDAQQANIIKKMVRDLHMDVEVVVCPIVREFDGLAMSSRNMYLSEEERKQALVLNESLKKAKIAVTQGTTNADEIRELIKSTIEKKPLAQIDYVDILCSYDLEECSQFVADAREEKDVVLAAVAVKFGKTRLIDNMFINADYDL